MKLMIEIENDGQHYAASINGSVPVIVGTLKGGINYDSLSELIQLIMEES